MTSNGVKPGEKTPPAGEDYKMTDMNDNTPTSKEAESTEKANLTEVKRRVSTHTAGQLRIATLVVSWISVVILSILGLITFFVAVIDKSSASFAFALDAWLDCLSSLVVIWRFYSAESLYNRRKEKKACIALGVLFLISFISVAAQSSHRLYQGKPPLKEGEEEGVILIAGGVVVNADLVWYLAIVNAVTCLILFSAKAYLARQLESIAIATDAVNSAIGFLLAVATFVGDVIHEEHPHIWYLDPVLGIVCSACLLVYGIWIIVYEVKLNKNIDEYTNMDE